MSTLPLGRGLLPKGVFNLTLVELVREESSGDCAVFCIDGTPSKYAGNHTLPNYLQTDSNTGRLAYVSPPHMTSWLVYTSLRRLPLCLAQNPHTFLSYIWSKLKHSSQWERGLALANVSCQSVELMSAHLSPVEASARLQKFILYCTQPSPLYFRAAWTIREE